MRKSYITAVAIAAAIALPGAAVLAAHGGGGGHGHPFDTGAEFGNHISDMANQGHLDGEMNPGVHHRGYSPWAPGN